VKLELEESTIENYTKQILAKQILYDKLKTIRINILSDNEQLRKKKLKLANDKKLFESTVGAWFKVHQKQFIPAFKALNTTTDNAIKFKESMLREKFLLLSELENTRRFIEYTLELEEQKAEALRLKSNSNNRRSAMLNNDNLGIIITLNRIKESIETKKATAARREINK